MNDVIESLVEAIKNSKRDKATKILIPKQEGIELNSKNFHDIADVNCENKIAFIDGGNNELIKTPSMSLQFIRVYYNNYSKNVKISSDKCEFFLLVESVISKEKLNYKCKIFAQKKGAMPKEEHLIFDASDYTIREGVAKASASKIGEVVRKIVEWTMCMKIMKELGEGDYIVKDGTLDADFVGEKQYKDVVLQEASTKGICISGLAKTNNLLADNGESAAKVLNDMCSLGTWKYYPVVKNSKIYFVKLNSNSKHVFRLDLVEGDVEKLLSLLVDNATDPIFLGYPYGLIDADKFGRVSNHERDYLFAKIQMKLGKSFSELEKSIVSLNAHKILDNV